MGVFARLKEIPFVAKLRQHPTGFWFVFMGELAERASYYGMRTLLALYLVDVVGFEQNKGATVVHLFMAFCYLLPLLGGFIADRYLGRYKTIVYFSIPYIAGHFLLGATHTPLWIYFALGLLAMGSGTIKPSTSPLMGMIYEKAGKSDLLPEAFSIFYLSINIGSLFSTYILPSVRESFKPATGWTEASRSLGYQVALAFPTVLMIVALGIFALGKRYYPAEKVTERPQKTPEQARAETATLLRLAGVFTLIIFWWFIYDQNADIWVYFARDHMNLQLWPFTKTITPDQIQAVNPFFIIAFTPFFNWQWNAIKARRGGRAVPATQKMLLGFLLTAVTALIMMGAAMVASTGVMVSVWWQILAFAMLTYAELCISMVGLEFAYEQALPGTKSTVTAVFFLTIFVGDLLGAAVVHYYEHPLSPTNYFAIQLAAMVACSILFWFVAKRFERNAEGPRAPVNAAAAA